MSLMLDEIRQQPEVLEAFLDAQPASLESLRSRYARSRPSLIVIVARGTSDNAALCARYLFEIAVGIPTSLAAPSIATLYNRLTMPGWRKLHTQVWYMSVCFLVPNVPPLVCWL